MTGYNIGEKCNTCSSVSNEYLFYISFAALGIGLGLERVGLGLGLGLDTAGLGLGLGLEEAGLVTAGLAYNTVFFQPWN